MMAFGITTICIPAKNTATLRIIDSQHNNTVDLVRYAERQNAVLRFYYAKCRYSECRGD